YPNPQSHPHIAAWREAFKQLGLSGKRFPSSIEALTRRVLSGRGLGNINPLVDFYNAISLQHIVPAGGWDVDDLQGDALLYRTRGGEPFHELGTSKLIQAEAGEVAYADDEQLITRHFVWRQSDRGKITPATRRVLLVSEILGPVGAEVAGLVRESLEEGLREHFGVEARTEILDERVSRWE
ncbi:MAG: phenylalanine--tRNA ligase beta subunit-related protein, partial [Acidobacteriota bacterium]